MAPKKGSIPWNKGTGKLTKQEYNRQYRLIHKDEIREQERKYQKEHPERGIKYREKHREKILEKNRQRYQKEKEAMKSVQKEWYKNNREYALERAKQYRLNNGKIILENRKKYYYANHEEELNRAKNYRKTPEGKIAMDRCTNKRKREMGYLPLNKPIENSHGHHIDIEHVIYIPDELHKSISHNVFTGKNMDTINFRAWDYLEASVL